MTEALRVTPEPWQAQALGYLASDDRISIRAGHGVGKTTFEAWAALWFLLTMPAVTQKAAKIPIVANSQDQLRDAMWSELYIWWKRLPDALQAEIEFHSERVSLKASPESFITARTASPERPEALQGLHAANMLFIIDEASGVIDKFFEVSLGAMSTPGSKSLLCGNPTRTEGFFHYTHHAGRSRWRTMRVSSEDVPRATGHIEDIIAKYGKESNAYRVRVLGEFPDTEDDAVIPLHLCEAAQARQAAQTPYRPVWGVDVARFGDDRITLAKRAGNRQLEPVKAWRQKDTMQIVGLVVQEWKTTDDDMKPTTIAVDVIGIGAGVVDRLRELGLPAVGINVGERPQDTERFMRLRDESWWNGREWLERPDSCLHPDDAVLVAELTGPKYKPESSGKIKVEGKDDMKKRGLPSPDVADAFLLTLARQWDQRRPDEQIDRYRRKLYSRGGGSSYMSV